MLACRCGRRYAKMHSARSLLCSDMSNAKGQRLDLERITHRFGDMVAVHDINVAVAPGEITTAARPTNHPATIVSNVPVAPDETEPADAPLNWESIRKFVRKVAGSTYLLLLLLLAALLVFEWLRRKRAREKRERELRAAADESDSAEREE